MNKLKKRIFNYLDKKGNVEDVFCFMGIITIISLCIVFSYVNQLGLTFQQGCIFIGDGLKSFLNTVAYFDKNSPGVLSLVGTLVGAVIGFAGAMLVFYLQGNYKYKQDKRKIMLLLLNVYEGLKAFYEKSDVTEALREYEFNPNEYNKKYKEGSQIHYLHMNIFKMHTGLIYDDKWKDYIVTFKDIDELFFVRELLLDIESQHIFSKEQYQTIIKKLRKVLVRHRFRKYIYLTDKRIDEQFKALIDENIEEVNPV